MGAGQGNGEDQSYLSQGNMFDSISRLDQILTAIGINAVQQSVFGQNNQTKSGSENSEIDQKKQDVHAAVDQAHPEKISEYMRDKYMSRTDEMDKEEGRS